MMVIVGELKGVSMEFKEYQQLAKRTASRINPHTGEEFDEHLMLLHAAIGLVTESAELLDAYKKHMFYGSKLDMVNVKEEIGDCFWYVALAYETLDRDIKAHELDSLLSDRYLVRVLAAEAGSLLLDVDAFQESILMLRKLNALVAVLISICMVLKIDYHDVLAANINKLMVRYPSKFAKDAAENRRLDVERKVLEKTTGSLANIKSVRY